jgi:alcohol dehydrogenase class IV
VRTFRSISPERVHTGSGCIARLGRSLDDVAAKRVLVMTTASLSQFVNEIETLVGARHMGTFGGCSQHSPAASVGAAAVMAEGADAIVSFGGGSVIDTAKAVAGRVGYPAQIAIPTTLSAGEFTPGAGITEETDRVKHVSVDMRALPKVVIHDPQLTQWTPRQLWLSSGIKALDHALETLWWVRPHPMTHVIAEDAAKRLLKWLPKSIDSNAIEAREHCLLGAWMSIQGLFAAGARLSHPLGHQIGAFWDVPHGITSCVTLPAVMRSLDELTSVVREQIAPLFGAADGQMAADVLTRYLKQLDLPTRLRETSAVREEIPMVAAAVTAEFEATGRPPEVNITELLESMW